MNDLIEFLRARLDEDERVARAATPGPWRHNPGKQWLGPDAFEAYDLAKGEEFVGHGGPSPFTGCVAATGPASHPQSMADARHIALHDPARVLREVEAKRRILDMWESPEAAKHPGGVDGRDPDEQMRDVAVADAIDEVVRLLALGYSDHPDYQESWRP